MRLTIDETLHERLARLQQRPREPAEAIIDRLVTDYEERYLLCLARAMYPDDTSIPPPCPVCAARTIRHTDHEGNTEDWCRFCHIRLHTPTSN